MGAQRGDVHQRFAEPGAEGRVQQRPVVEVGAQGDHHGHASVGIVYDGEQSVEESSLNVSIIDEGEQLLELVDNEEQASVVTG